MLPYWGALYGNPHSSDHSVGWKSKKTLDQSRKSVADFLNVPINEIVFTSGATESNNLAILGFDCDYFGTNGNVAVSEVEHKCVLEAAAILSGKIGKNLTRISVNADGSFCETSLKDALEAGAKFCSIMLVNNEIGTINDLKLASDICRQYGAILHCDAAQAALFFSLEMLSNYADCISISSHKLGGPMGIGALYISNEIRHLMRPLIVGGGQESGMRSGTVPLPLAVGFGVACEKLIDEPATDRYLRVAKLRDSFANEVLSINPNFRVNGPELDKRHPGNLNVCFAGFEASVILSNLQPSVAASQGSACSSGFEETSYVLRSIGLDEKDANASIRFSLGLTTSDSEIKQALRHLKLALEKSSL